MKPQEDTKRTKLKEITKTRAIDMLVKGFSMQKIANKLKISSVTVFNIKNENLAQINELKKQNKDAILQSESEKYRQFVQDCLDKARQTIPYITDDKLKLCSAPQLATTAAIMVDKYNIGVGNATGIIHHTHTAATRDDIIAQIKGAKPPEQKKVNITPNKQGNIGGNDVPKIDLPSEKGKK